MDLEEIKKMINEGEKIIIVENGKPEIVIMNYSEYQKSSPAKMGRGERREQSSLRTTEEKFTIDDLPII